MTRVDFYVLDEPSSQARLKCACRIAEKAYQLENRVYIHVPDQNEARLLDDLLWTFRDRSFVPHALAQDGAARDVAVLIGSEEDAEPPDGEDLLINLGSQVPLFFSRFRRVAEIVTEDPAQRRSGRDRFRFYRDRGYDLHTHQLR
jgi:DNA polymerase-3 subunit chi